MRWLERERLLMQDALELARLGKGKTYPNPAVGAVVVKAGRIVGRGFHRRWGSDHAEIEAMRDAGKRSRGADLYVTLEPCCHYGKTPPCVDAIIAQGIRRVVIPTIDPNPLVDGKGAKALRQAGIRVDIGLEAEAARRLNEEYFKHMTTGLPFVTLKVAQTLDGKIATRTGDAHWITSGASRRLVRAMRAGAQALVIGRGTVAADDPMLLPEPRRRQAYVRCVLDARLATSPRARIVKTAREFPVTFYCGPAAPPSLRRALERAGARVREVRQSAAGRLDLRQVLADLAALKTMHVWVEGGSAVFTSFLRQGLADKLVVFVAPRVMGGGGSIDSFADLGVLRASQCPGFAVDGLEEAEGDLVITLYPKRRVR